MVDDDGAGEPMIWVVLNADRQDVGAILMFVDDEDEAQEIAAELRTKGLHISVAEMPRRLADQGGR